MRLRKIGAVLAGAALLGATLAGAVAAQDVPPEDFFVDPATGEPNVVIVVGSGAAAMDVVSATMLAAKIGTMTYTEEPGEVTFTKTYKAVHENIDPFLINFNVGPWLPSTTIIQAQVWGLGFCTVDVPDAGPYLGWEFNYTPINYTLASLWYFDDYYNVYWGDGDEHYDPWETHEEIQIRFDDFYDTQDDMFFVYSDCLACLYGGDIDLYNIWDGDLGNLWAWYAIPGLIYRADNIFVPPSIAVYMKYNHPYGRHIVGLDYERRRTFYVPEPWMVLWGMLPQFKLFHTIYTVVDAGPVLDQNGRTGELGPLFGTPYIVTGDPNFMAQVYLYKHEPMEFGPYKVELMDADVDHNKAWFVISQDGDEIANFWMVLDPLHGFSPNLQQMGIPFNAYDTWNDLDGDGEIDPDEFGNIITYDWDGEVPPEYYNKWVVGRAEKDVWGAYQWKYYIDNRNDPWYLVYITDFVLDGVKVFIGAQGTIGIEIKVYWLENKKVWYNHLCCDPWVTEPNNYQLFLDAYESGWDPNVNGFTEYQPPGTGLWPQAGLAMWYSYVGNHFMGDGFLDQNDGHIGYEYNCLNWLVPTAFFPEQNNLDRDDVPVNIYTKNDCRNCAFIAYANCFDMYDIEDPVYDPIRNPTGWFPPGQAMVEINIALCDKICTDLCEYKWVVPGPYPRDPPYFTIEVTDVLFSCGDGDGINYDTIMEETQITEYTAITPADIDETGLVMLDTELDFAGWKGACDYNLILIGGPVANIIVKQLVDEGISTVDWAASPGEWEYIEAPYDGCDILIIAGSDRDATRAAAQSLIDQ
ncbi:MAG: S-layer protein, partial [Theionarchaea archaeon]|nr:S-layer protein [Theionarchaea archaeon]